MPQNIDVKEYSTFGSDQDVTAQFNSVLGTLRSSGLALSAFNLTYGPESKHNVETITVRARRVVGAPPGVDRFMMEASMNDKNRHQAVSAATFATPAVLAGGNDTPGLELQTGELPTDRGLDFTFTQPVEKAYAVLGGFSVGYGQGNDHFVMELKASASAVASGKTVTVTGSASISDRNNHEGTGPVQALVIGRAEGDSTRFQEKRGAPGGKEVEIPLPDVTSIDQAAVFITGFSLNYGNSDHDVRQILLDAGNNSLKIDNAASRPTIRFTPKAFMTDGTNTVNGTFDLLVIAVPTPKK